MECEKSCLEVCLIQSNCVYLYQKAVFNEQKTIKMGYVAIQNDTNKAYYSKGANKIADKIECNPTTITRNLKKVGDKKEIKGYIVFKVEDLSNQNRGNNIRSSVLR